MPPHSLSHARFKDTLAALPPVVAGGAIRLRETARTAGAPEPAKGYGALESPEKVVGAKTLAIHPKLKRNPRVDPAVREQASVC